MNNQQTVLRFLIALLMISGIGKATFAGAGAFGDLFTAGALVAGGNCDGLWAGRVVALIGNPAHAVWGDRWSAGGGYRQLYGVDALQRTWAGGKYRRNHWGVGVAISQFGKRDFYTETVTAICLGLRIRRNVAVGVNLDHLQLAYTPDMPNYAGWAAGLGIIFQPQEQIIVTGAIGEALNSDFIADYRLPGRYQLSGMYSVSAEIQLGASWTKKECDGDLVGLGQRLGLVRHLYFLSAVYFNPARYALGAEIILRGQSVFYTYLSHPDLGGTHYVEFAMGQ